MHLFLVCELEKGFVSLNLNICTHDATGVKTPALEIRPENSWRRKGLESYNTFYSAEETWH